MPQEAKPFDYDKNTQYLIKVCSELQQLRGEGPFYLSDYKAAEIIDGDLETAKGIMGRLVSDGIITLIKPAAVNHAPRYRYNYENEDEGDGYE